MARHINPWEEVAHSAPGGGSYEWDDFDVRWTGDQFAWSRQSGCSCNSFEYDQDKYQTGTKADLVRAIYDWDGGGHGNSLDIVRLIEKIYESGH